MRVGCCLLLATISSALFLTGCGTYVPGYQEFPGTANDGELLVRAIAESVRCQVQGAVQYLLAQDRKAAVKNRGLRSTTWFDSWGIQYSLTLTVEESSSVNPGLTWAVPSPASSVFTLGAGAKLSSTATRQSKMNFFYTVKELQEAPPCAPVSDVKYKAQSFLIRDDLGLKDWLVNYSLIVASGAGNVPTNDKTPLKDEAFTDDVKFEVVSSGDLSPAWKLSRLDVNKEGSLLSASRDRTHELLITYGPIDPTTKRLAGPASDAFLTSQIGAAIDRSGL